MGFGGAKRLGDALKSSFGVAMQVTREGDSFNAEKGLCNTAVLKLYCKSYWVL